MELLENLKWFVEDGRNISGLVLSKADCTELLNLVKNGEMTKFDAEMTKLNEKELYKSAFETYDLIVNWVIENRCDVIEEIEKKHMNIDWAYRLLKGLVENEE